jgi:hypothetical protein
MKQQTTANAPHLHGTRTSYLSDRAGAVFDCRQPMIGSGGKINVCDGD